MRFLPTVLLLIALGASAVLAQTYSATTTTTTGTTTSMLVCPSTAAILPNPCPAIVASTFTGDQTLLVLGSQESFVYDNVEVGGLGWRDVPLAYQSYTTEDNPLTYSHVNRAVTRHGNPYFPYYAVGPTTARVSGTLEQYVNMSQVSSPDRALLSAVATRYRGLTETQARTLGYEPAGAYTAGVGQVYNNRALLDNQVNVQTPEAFIFDNRGKLMAVQYYALTPQPVTMFGQASTTSTLVQGAQVTTVWLYRSNPNGMFSPINPNVR
jgi:hypothetical protein